MINAYPLAWPEGWKRTAPGARTDGRFSKDRKDLSVSGGVERVLVELTRFGISRNDLVISTNVETRLDGLPRSDRGAPGDPGVAVYWQERKGTRRVIAIDQYTRVADNLAAIAATLDAMRAIERHGGARILERAFTGFTALPAPAERRPWRAVFNVSPEVMDIGFVRTLYSRLARTAHPDIPGGSHTAMVELNLALEDAIKELS